MTAMVNGLVLLSSSLADAPVVAVATDYGLHGFAMSRYASLWVGFKCVTDVVESGASVYIDPHRVQVTIPTDFVLPPGGDLSKLLTRPALSQLVAIYSGQGQNLELQQPLLLGNTQFASLRIGVSTLLIRQDLDASLRPAASPVTAWTRAAREYADLRDARTRNGCAADSLWLPAGSFIARVALHALAVLRLLSGGCDSSIF